jgi:hypothetical protein
MYDKWQQIERMTAVGAAGFWRHIGCRGIPVIVEGAVPDWRPESQWSLDYLRRTVGHRMARPDHGYFEETSGTLLPVAEILDAIESGLPVEGSMHPYLRNVDVHRDLPELAPDLTPRLAYVRPNWLSCVLLKRHVPDGLVEFFVGGAGSAFPKLHVDTHGTHAFITQLKGRKRVVMAAPSETAALVQAFGDPEKFDMDADPATLERLNMVTAMLTPGDTLFIPSGWHHVAYMSELSISVSTNVVNASNWPQHLRAVTKHTEGLKKPLKVAAYLAIGVLLRMHDRIGASFLYRHYD